MKQFSRLVAAMVALALMLTGIVFAESQGTVAEKYQDALSRLERYLMNLQDDPVDVVKLAEDFQKLGSYEGSSAFYYYTLALADASNSNYTLIPMYIDALVINTSFDERLTKLREEGTNIPSIAEWAAYLNGRVAESEGNYAEAAAQYQQCLNFMDAQTRILYALAWNRQPTSAAATAVPTAQPTPVPTTANAAVNPPTLSAKATGSSISVEWTAVSGAANYSLYRRRTNFDKEFQLIYSGSALSYQDKMVLANYNYTYYITATTSDGKQLTSEEKSAIILDNSGAATKTPTPTNTPTPAPTQAPTPTPTPAPQWSAWTQWSTTPVSSSATRQVETKVETETYMESVYHYSRWRYYNTSWGQWAYSYTEYTGSNYKAGSGEWQYKTTYEPLASNGLLDGHTRYTDYWWNQTVSQEQKTREVTYYRYRDLQ